MADNALKTPLAQALARFADDRANNKDRVLGKVLPCHAISANGPMITVAFDVTGPFTLGQQTIPIFGPIYLRYPIQPGDKGLALSADVSIANQAGLGGGVPNANSTSGNLGSTLVFLPFGNTDWSAVDPNAVVAYGPNGVVLRDTNSQSVFTLTPTSITCVTESTGTITIDNGISTLTMGPSGYSLTGTASGLVEAAGGLTLKDGTNYLTPSLLNAWWNALYSWLSTHEHSGVTAGGANTGYPTTSPPATSPAPAN
jgi:hypothetical protein